jgi:hypothetical protein
MLKKIIFLFLFLTLFIRFLYAQGNKWQEFRSEHFIIYYKEAPMNFIQHVSDRAEGYYNKIADELGFTRYNFWLWENRAKIYIYNNIKDYQAATGQPDWSYGSVSPEAKIINSFVYEKDFFDTILPHELGHIIFREFVGFNNSAVPKWLEEGIASYQEKNKYIVADQIVKTALKDGTFLNIEQLALFSPAIQGKKTVEIFYAESISIVRYLIREFGRDNFTLFCQALRDKKDLTRAIASVYSFSNINELGVAWQKYLNK